MDPNESQSLQLNTCSIHLNLAAVWSVLNLSEVDQYLYSLSHLLPDHFEDILYQSEIPCGFKGPQLKAASRARIPRPSALEYRAWSL